MDYVGIVNPPHLSKECESETLRLRLRAPLFYPTTLPSVLGCNFRAPSAHVLRRFLQGSDRITRHGVIEPPWVRAKSALGIQISDHLEWWST